jgi:hypothetical protein
MSNPIYYKSCNELNNNWEQGNTTLKYKWTTCMEGANMKNDPENKDLSKEDLIKKENIFCCNKVMQCDKPNEWFQQNNINSICVTNKKINEPIFGDLHVDSHRRKMLKTMMAAVY